MTISEVWINMAGVEKTFATIAEATAWIRRESKPCDYVVTFCDDAVYIGSFDPSEDPDVAVSIIRQVRMYAGLQKPDGVSQEDYETFVVEKGLQHYAKLFLELYGDALCF